MINEAFELSSCKYEIFCRIYVVFVRIVKTITRLRISIFLFEKYRSCSLKLLIIPYRYIDTLITKKFRIFIGFFHYFRIYSQHPGLYTEFFNIIFYHPWNILCNIVKVKPVLKNSVA